MERYDFHADIRRALAGQKLKKTGPDIYEFRCVRHDDSHASAWLGEHRWGCRTCVFEEPLDTLAEYLGVEVPPSGFTVEQYAERKGFSVSLLARWGVKTVRGQYGNVVEIPYHAADGTVLRAKWRAATKSFWGPGKGTYLYGLKALAESPGAPVILVEGESDCHACWHTGVLAVGVPGATAWKPDWAPFLAGRTIYAWKEPGEPGAKFIASVAQSFPDVKVLSHPTAKDLADLFKDEGKTFPATVAGLMREAAPSSHTPPTVHFDAVAGGTLQRLLQRKLAPIQAIATPLPTWNQACRDEGGRRGLARGWHITAGARTGAGKSLLALNLAACAVMHGERVSFNSLEMSQAQLITRYLSILSGESVAALEQGAGFRPEAYARAERVANRMEAERGGCLFVNAEPMSDLQDIRAAIRYQVEQRGCGMVITDYLQLARVVGKSELLETVTEVSAVIRREARELNIVSVGLSQFNRETSKDRDNPPSPQGLMGGSPLENDSDQVLLLDHTHYTRDDSTQSATTRLLLAKNRHGSLHDIPVTWDYRTLTLTEVIPEEARGPYNPGDAPDREEEADRGEAWEAPTEPLASPMAALQMVR